MIVLFLSKFEFEHVLFYEVIILIEWVKSNGVKLSIGIVSLLIIVNLVLKKEETPVTFEIQEQVYEIEETEYIYVDLKGFVKNPGVYKLEKGSRVFQVIAKAGGYIENADKNALNLSKKLYDQEVIYIPNDMEEYPLITEVIEDESKGIIDINRASKSLLQTLPGVGPSTAQSIIDYRNEIGEFETIEDIMKVSGIGESTFEEIKESITIN